jgi:glucose/arabinose dehydrogenase
MRRAKVIIGRLLASLALGAGCCVSVSAAASPLMLPANTVPPVTVPQDAAASAEIEATLKFIRLPRGFRIALLAIVPGARDMAVAADGRKIFVGTLGDETYVVDLATPAGPVTSVRNFAPSIAKVMAHGVCLGPDKTLYLAEQNRILAFPDAAARADSATLAARVVVRQGALIPPSLESRGHSARVCRVGPDGDLYVTIGQPTNVPSPAQWRAFSSDGLGAIIRMKTDGTAREVFATGIRNSVGLDFNPKDKTLWFTDNQVDMMGDDIPPGELNRAPQAGLHFGFPWYGGGHVRTAAFQSIPVPPGVMFPQIEMTAHAADLGMTFYRGTTFPASYSGGIFSAQHGSWNRTVPVGARIMFTTLRPDGTAQGTAPFAEGWLSPDGAYRGRPVDVAESTDGALLVSDDLSGAIYRLSFEGKPAP